MAKDWQKGKGNKALLHLLNLKKLTKSDLARLLDVSNTTIHIYLTNPYTITLRDYYTIAGVLDVNVHVLIYAVVSNQPLHKVPIKWYEELTANSVGIIPVLPALNPSYEPWVAKAKRNESERLALLAKAKKP